MRPGFTARLSEPPACSAFDPRRDAVEPSFLARRRGLSAPTGSAQENAAQHHILPEPETRNGLSLARNDAFATITRSMLPTCSFASTSVSLRVPVRSKAPPLSSVSKPKNRANSSLRTRCPPTSDALVTAPDLHSPLGFSTLRIKAFNRFHHNKLAPPDAR
jgi:hypothetical protein